MHSTLNLGHMKGSVHFKVRVVIFHLYVISSWPFIQETSQLTILFLLLFVVVFTDHLKMTTS